MAARTPVESSKRVYRGAAGQTRKEPAHYTCPCGTRIAVEVYRSVDVSAEPELGERLRSPDSGQPLNTAVCPESGEPVALQVPVIYHDPEQEIFALILPDSARHRELDERAALLAELARDAAAIPSYVLEFKTVFGHTGLERLLADEAEKRQDDARRLALESEVETLRGSISHGRETERDLASLRDKAAEQDQAIERYKAEIAGMEARLAAMEEQRAALEARETRDNEQLETSRSEVTRERDAIVRERDEIAGQRDEIAGQRDEIAGQRSDLETRSGELDRLVEELETRKGELETRQGELDAREGELETRKGELETRKGELETGKGELDTREGELDARKGELDRLAEELDARKGELDRLIEELETGKGELETGKGELETRQGELDARQDELETRKGELDARQGELDARAEALRQDSEELSQQRQELFRQMADPGSVSGAGAPSAAAPLSLFDDDELGALADDGFDALGEALAPLEGAVDELADLGAGSRGTVRTSISDLAADDILAMTGASASPPSSPDDPPGPPAERPVSDDGPRSLLLDDDVPEPVPLDPPPQRPVVGLFDDLPDPEGFAAMTGGGMAAEPTEHDALASDGSDDKTEITPGRGDPTIQRWIASGERALKSVDESGQVRIAVSVSSAGVDMLVGDPLELRIQLHRLPSYPLVNLVIGSAASLRGEPGLEKPVSVPFDVSSEDRAVLEALRRRCQLSLEVYDNRYAPAHRRELGPDSSGDSELAENVGAVLSAADDYLIEVSPSERSYARAVAAMANPEYDVFGWQHPERSEFREDKLTELGTGRAVRRALAIANRFSSPKRQDYLFFIRAYPRARWQRDRSRVLERAIGLGIWLGPRLAQIAVSEGLARSRKDLIKILHGNFARFVGNETENDLDGDAISDNWSALGREAETLGIDLAPPSPAGPGAAGAPAVPSRTGPVRTVTSRATPPKAPPLRAPPPRAPPPRSPPPKASPPKTPPPKTAGASPQRPPRTIDSGHEPVASGAIHEDTARIERARMAVQNLSSDELLARLEDPTVRVEVAMELARRRERRAVVPVMNAVERMNRADSVNVLGAVGNFGEDASAELVAALDNSKPFIRQGAALALAVLASEEAIEALSDQLLSEPTTLWREIARGLGLSGPRAIGPLASRLADQDSSKRERVAWAMAHIAVRGRGSTLIERIAGGRDPVAASVARRALELREQAQKDDVDVRGENTPTDQTVNRAFSRQFFQALEATSAVVGSPPEMPPEISSPALVLDEADLLEAVPLDQASEDEEPEVLDVDDLIP